MSEGGARLQTSGGTAISERAWLEHPFAAVWASMLAHSSPRLPAMDASRGEALVGVRLAGLPVYKNVRLEVGQPTVPGDSRRVVLPLRWRPTGLSPVFPELDGELILEPFGVERTLMTLTGSYRPPAGRLGDAVDAALMHRLAEGTARDFVDRLTAGLHRELSRPACG